MELCPPVINPTWRPTSPSPRQPYYPPDSRQANVRVRFWRPISGGSPRRGTRRPEIPPLRSHNSRVARHSSVGGPRQGRYLRLTGISLARASKPEKPAHVGPARVPGASFPLLDRLRLSSAAAEVADVPLVREQNVRLLPDAIRLEEEDSAAEIGTGVAVARDGVA